MLLLSSGMRMCGCRYPKMSSVILFVAWERERGGCEWLDWLHRKLLWTNSNLYLNWNNQSDCLYVQWLSFVFCPGFHREAGRLVIMILNCPWARTPLIIPRVRGTNYPKSFSRWQRSARLSSNFRASHLQNWLRVGFRLQRSRIAFLGSQQVWKTFVKTLAKQLRFYFEGKQIHPRCSPTS